MESHSEQQDRPIVEETGGQAVAEEETVHELFQAKDISPEEEEGLMKFLMKVQNACKQDSSVPDFVGSQVDTWMQELIAKQPLEQDKAEERDQQAE